MWLAHVACSIACQINFKLNVAHVRRRLFVRSLTNARGDHRMVTDALRIHFFTTSEIANENLRKIWSSWGENPLSSEIHVDTLMGADAIGSKTLKVRFLKGLETGNYFVNDYAQTCYVDQEHKLKAMIEQSLKELKGLPIYFPCSSRETA